MKSFLFMVTALLTEAEYYDPRGSGLRSKSIDDVSPL